MIPKQNIVTDTNSKEYKLQQLNFIISKLPVKLTPHHHNQFDNYFKGFDQERKGYININQVYSGIKDYLNLDQLFQAKKAIQRSFQKAAILQNQRYKIEEKEQYGTKSPSNRKKLLAWIHDSNDYLNKKGFWYFLLILCRQYELYVMFEILDYDKNGKLNLQEFEHALEQFQEWGYNGNNVTNEFYQNSQNMNGMVFYDDFCKWADKNNLKMYENGYVMDTIQQHYKKYKFPENDLNIIYKTSGESVIIKPGQKQIQSQEGIDDKHNKYFQAKILNKEKKLQVFKINKKTDINASLNEQQNQILNEIQIDQEIEQKLQQLSYEQKLSIKENPYILSIEKGIQRVKNSMENPETSESQLKIDKETLHILNKQLRDVKRNITFNLAEKNNLHQKILKEIFDFYVSTDVYRTEHRRKKALEYDVLSKKQFLVFSRQFPFLETKMIKMEAIQKIINFNLTEKEHTGLTFNAFRKCIEMIGAYIYTTKQDNRQETTENLQQVYNLMGFYNHTYKIYMGLPLPPGKHMGQSTSQDQSMNYNDYTLNLNPNTSINTKIKSKQQNQDKDNQTISHIAENLPTSNNNDTTINTNRKVNKSKSVIRTSHGYNLNKINSVSVKSNKKILPDNYSNHYLQTVSQESMDDSLAFSNVSEIQEHSQILEEDQNELQNLQLNGDLNNSQNLNNSLLNESGHRISFSKLQEDTKKNVNYFSKVMLREEQNSEMFDSKKKIDLKFDEDDEDPFLHLDSMLNQRKKIKEIFYFYTKQKQGYATFERILHEINVFSLGQFSQFCRQFKVLQGRRKEIPRVFKKAGKSPKELTLQEFESLLEILAQEQYADSDLYKTREEKILAFYNYLGFDIHNTYKEKMILLKKPFNIDVEEGYRLLEKDKKKFQVKSKENYIQELRELEKIHQQEMKRLHQKQLQDQYNQRQSVLLMKQQDEKMQQIQANKNAMYNKKINPILQSNYFENPEENQMQKKKNSKSVDPSKKQWYTISQPKFSKPPVLFQNKSQLPQEFQKNASLSTTNISKSQINLGKSCKLHKTNMFPNINIKQNLQNMNNSKNSENEEKILNTQNNNYRYQNNNKNEHSTIYEKDENPQ